MVKKCRALLSVILASVIISFNIAASTVMAEDSTYEVTESQSQADAELEAEQSQEESASMESEIVENAVEEKLELTPENPDSLNTVTGMNEDGVVYEVEAESGTVETTASKARSASGQIVNFNTKGAETTEYTEVDTGASGYTCGAYGADAAYLGTSNGMVKFMLSGVIGQVSESEVQIVDIANASSISYYVVSSGRLIHKVTTDVSGSSYATSLDNGPAPSYLTEGTSYYSYDGHYFYTYDTFSQMLSDYNNGTRSGSVNPDSPYYNYFQYLPLRSISNYSGSKLNDIINNKVSDTSKMRDIGETLVEMQNTYGVNALIMTGIAANESAWGNSNISQNKNNLFGLNAVDSSPGESANYYEDVKVCIKDFAETYMSKRYLRSGYTYYKGAFLGSKVSGINVSYASDPYWGEKAANVAWTIDKTNGNADDCKYTIGIKDTLSNEHTTLNVRKESNTDSTVLYKTVSQSHYSFLILDNAETENGFYRVQSDPVLDSARSAIDTSTGVYDFNNMYAYSSSDYITLVNTGSNVGNIPEPEPEPEWDVVDPVPVPSELAEVLNVTPHVVELGWMDSVGNGEQAGTVNASYTLDGIQLAINNISGLGIEYSAHVQTYGWQDYVADGATAGKPDENKRLEAIKIRLTGDMKDEYTVMYRAHVQTYGWQNYVSDDELAGTIDESKRIEALQIVILKKAQDVEVSNKDIITYNTYVSNIGWRGNPAHNGEQSGTLGLSYPIESIKISSGVEGLGVEYTTYIPNIGWQDYVADGVESKVESDPKRIEAVKIRLTGDKAENYDLYYRVHAQKYGWLGWAKNDEAAGTKGYSYRIEAIQIAVVEKGADAPGTTQNAFVEKPVDVVYSSYINGQGWQDSVKNGATSGETGKSQTIGAIEVKLENVSDSGTVKYAGHIQGIGWDSWKEAGEICGTTEGNKRLEAFKIKLTGDLSQNYDIYYRSYVENLGWLGWAKNGSKSGTEGYGYRIEAIEIQMVKKGAQAPGSVENSFKSRYASVNYSAHVQSIGWQESVSDGALAGTSQQSLRMEAVKINLSNQQYTGNIKYSAHVQGIGWQSYVQNGKISGTVGQGKRVEAFKIMLTGDLAEYCDVYYRVHIQTYGWTGWAKNGEAAGSEGLSKRMEAIEVMIVTKGEQAPDTSGTKLYTK